MKVYSLPKGVKPPKYNFGIPNFDWNAEERRFFHDLKTKLASMGYSDGLSGKCFYIPWADGAAVYMIAQAGRKTILIHCPIGDAWNVPEYMTRGIKVSDLKKRSYDPIDSKIGV